MDKKYITQLKDTCFNLCIPTEAKIAFNKFAEALEKEEIQRLRGLILYSIFNTETAFDMARIHENDIASWYAKMREILDPDLSIFDEMDCEKIIAVLAKEKAERDETIESSRLFEKLMLFL